MLFLLKWTVEDAGPYVVKLNFFCVFPHITARKIQTKLYHFLVGTGVLDSPLFINIGRILFI